MTSERRPRERTSAGRSAIGRFLRGRSAAKAGIVVTAAAISLAPFPQTWVERFYSNGLYPAIQSVLTPLSDWAPFALADVWIIAAVVILPGWWTTRIFRAGRRKRWRTAGLLFLNTIVAVAAAFLLFELLWGLNYARLPLNAKLDFNEEQVSRENLYRLTSRTVQGLNSVSAELDGVDESAAEWRLKLHASLDAVVTGLGRPKGIRAGTAKRTVFNRYLAATGIAGFFNPFGHEVVLESGLLPIEVPFSLAHEWAHQAGFADESEANFIGLLACVRSESSLARYSGWLALYEYLPRRMNGEGIALPEPAPRVKADLSAIAARIRSRYSQTLGAAQSRVYDGFLKANNVEAGIGSYGLLVRLVLGTRFEGDWVPIRKRMQ